MPVILERDQVDRWLAEPDLTLLRPYSGEIVITAANKAVGAVKNEGPELLVADGPLEPPKGDLHD
jgi:putative SOS response-associated peptidase YedK